MIDVHQVEALSGVSDVYLKPIGDLYDRIKLFSRVKILVVVDGSVSLTEAPSGFGVGRVVRLLRESHIGCTYFSVDLARRNNAAPATNNQPGPGDPRYVGFRFDQQEANQPILNKYHEVWCFGFNPGNDAGPDANITNANQLPASDAELKALTRWMNERRGGLLAMGDHDYLGASMCHRIPRIRSMRRWTNAQGVPPIGGINDADTALRHDTNQPATPAQINAGGLIPFSNQEDATAQKIDWVPWISQQISIFQVRERPHPILCHPDLGPIDVMPDHPHEGWLFEDGQINLSATYQFQDLTGSEYPTVNGKQPRPRVIAHGTTTPNPPYNLAKGPSPKKRFAMVGVYDGHSANVGRVVTDSTWHHWFDENIQALEAENGTEWKKISRYYLNVAKWLAPPGVNDWCLVFALTKSYFTYLGFQEYSPKHSIFDLGKPFHTQLVRYLGPCWVTQWVFDKLDLIDDDFWAWLKDRLFWKDGIPVPGGDPCLSCPPFELLEIAVLGGLVRAGLPVADQIKAHVAKTPDRPLELDPERILKQELEGVAIGLKEFRQVLEANVRDLQAVLR
ncbi:MAG: hypothetical protein ACKVVP_17845 [Chloroflexota bacterium]